MHENEALTDAGKMTPQEQPQTRTDDPEEAPSEDPTFTSPSYPASQDEDETETLSTPNHKNRRFALGLAALLLVDLVWVASAELTEFIFHTAHFDKPFFSSYLKTSIFGLFLVGFAFHGPWQDRVWYECGGGGNRHAYNLLDPADPEPLDDNASDSSLSPPTFIPISRPSSGNDSDSSQHQRSVRFNKLAEVRHLSDSDAAHAVYARLSYAASREAELLARRLAGGLGIGQTARLSLHFCLMWFVGAYTYQLAISRAEAGVVNLLSSSSGVFTLVLGGVWPAGPGDKFSWTKLVLVVGSCGGVALVTIAESGVERVPWGAVYAVVSALAYSSYLVFLRRRVGEEERLDLFLFFGFVGVFNLLLLWPGFFLLHCTGLEVFEWPSHSQWMYLVLNGLVGTVAAEVLWLWGSLLTTSLIATLAVGLTVPLTLLADVYLKRVRYEWVVYGGALPIVACFVGIVLVSHWGADPVGRWCRRRRLRVEDQDGQREALIGEEPGEDVL